MRSRSSGPMIGVGLAVVVLAAFVFLRTGRRTEESADAPDTPPARPMKQSERVQQRLEQLRLKHGAGTDAPRDMGARPPARLLPTRNTQRAGGAPAAAERVPQPAETDDDSGALDADPDDLPTLKTVAAQDPDPERRLAAVTMLGASDDP